MYKYVLRDSLKELKFYSRWMP